MTDRSPEAVAATLLFYVRASGALEASAVAEDGALVEVGASGSASVERIGGVSEPLDPAAALAADLGVRVRALPPVEVDAATGQVGAPLGGLQHMADGVRALARALGPAAVALVRFPTVDGVTDFAISAREGDGLVVVIGDDQYEMDAGWAPG